jgi:peptidoglycan hydrolase CwlO-like protein
MTNTTAKLAQLKTKQRKLEQQARAADKAYDKAAAIAEKLEERSMDLEEQLADIEEKIDELEQLEHGGAQKRIATWLRANLGLRRGGSDRQIAEASKVIAAAVRTGEWNS